MLHSYAIISTAFLKRLIVVLGLAATLYAQNPVQHSSVTAVEGDSWLNHLHRSFEETAMGKTWRLGPASQIPEEAAVAAPFRASRTGTLVLHGADLYRLNCQGCHGESGLGAPPEIASLINPVRSTSTSLIMQRMKSVGADMTRTQAAELASQSKAALLQRLHNGGQDMPSFSYLSDGEVRSLVAYLNLLADVPNAATHQVTVSESHARVGELIVKSTCHTCHAASGLNPGSAELAAGAIPPLATLTARVGRAGLIRKITAGAPVTMGVSPDSVRGRMPVFFYLREDEAADVYEYLKAYPPVDAADPNAADEAPGMASATSPAPTLFQPGAGEGSAQPPQPVKTASAFGSWLLCLSFSVVGLFGAGVTFTLRELRRLSTEAQRARLPRTRRVTVVIPMVAPFAVTARARRTTLRASTDLHELYGDQILVE